MPGDCVHPRSTFWRVPRRRPFKLTRCHCSGMHPSQNFTRRWLRDRYFIKRERCVAAGTVHSNCFHSAFLCGFVCFQFTLSVINISFTIVLMSFVIYVKRPMPRETPFFQQHCSVYGCASSAMCHLPIRRSPSLNLTLLVGATVKATTGGLPSLR